MFKTDASLTYTADCALTLMDEYGVNGDELAELIDAAAGVAEERRSPKIDFRHLVQAAGIPWGRQPDRERDGASE